MAYHTRSSSKKYRKAQFFVLSAFTIVTILFFVSQWIAPYTIPDTSSVVLMEEPYIFNNIVEKAKYVVNSSSNKTCEELTFNIEEYKNFVETYAIEKNMELDFNYNVVGCSQIDFKIRLKSPNVDLGRNFTMQWPS